MCQLCTAHYVCVSSADRKKNPTNTSSIDTELATYNFIPFHILVHICYVEPNLKF